MGNAKLLFGLKRAQLAEYNQSNMKKITKQFILLAVVAMGIAAVSSGCSQSDSDKAKADANAAGDAAKDAATKTGDAVKDAAVATKDAVTNAVGNMTSTNK